MDPVNSAGALSSLALSNNKEEYMSTVEDIKKALFDLVTSLPKANKECRKEIRDIILQLESELERSYTLAIIYLEGTYRIKPDFELIDHLANAPIKLLDTFNQYKICAGIYGIRDNFNQIFDPSRFAIAAGKSQRIALLLNDLANGERMIIDMLRSTTDMLNEAANDLRILSGSDFEERRAQLHSRVALEVNELKNLIKSVRAAVKNTLAQM